MGKILEVLFSLLSFRLFSKIGLMSLERHTSLRGHSCSRTLDQFEGSQWNTGLYDPPGINCPPPGDDSARSSKGGVAMSGGYRVDYPAGAKKTGQLTFSYIT